VGIAPQDLPLAALRCIALPVADAHRARYPALDGLRGLAVAAVFLFHCGLPWMRGGFLGVSTFFTLSGFLIMTLIGTEWARTGRIDVRRFWERRVRRLVPAAVLVIAVVLAGAPWFVETAARRALPGDALAAALYDANWHFARAGRSYAALFEDPSPLLHFWSLGVEGQFYLVFPLALALAARWGGWPGMGLLLASGGLASALTVARLADGPGSFDRIYFGSDTRAVELLVGALAALLAGRPGMRPGVALLGVLALAAQIVAWTTTTLDTPWVVRGGLGTYALTSALIVLAARETRGPVRALLGWRPLVRLGEISYGFYLVHWPIVLWLTPERLGLPVAAVAGLCAFVAAAVAEASYRWVELPIRQGRWPAERHLFAMAAVATAVLVVAIRLLPVPPVDPLFASVERTSRALNAGGAPPPVGSDVIRYAVFGDSTAAPTAHAFELWRTSHAAGTRFVPVAGHVRLGCGIMGPAERRDPTASAAEPCPDVVDEWATLARDGHVAVAIVQTGAWESREHALVPGGPTVRPGDAAFDAYLERQMERVADALAATGAMVVWIEAPHVGPGKQQSNGRLRLPPALRDPARIDRHNALLARVASARPGRVVVVDLPGMLEAQPGGELDPDMRPDGLHLTDAAAARLADTLGPAIAAAPPSAPCAAAACRTDE